MTITVLDTATGMRDVLDAPAPDRPDLLREMVRPAAGMYRYFPGEVDLAAMHAQSFGFPLDRSTDVVRQALTALREADAWARVERALQDAVAVQTRALPGITVPDLTVLMVLGDPDDTYFTDTVDGFSGNGSATGYLALTLWPTPGNLERLEAVAVHELHHNLRYAPGGVVWDPGSVVVGEQVVSEGLADAFARHLYGKAGYTPFGVPHLRDDAVLERVTAGLEVPGMHHFVAWVHGDAAARRFGAEPVGLPTGAGYAVGNRLVDAYLEATGTGVLETLHVPSREVIDVALAHLGLTCPS
ncbi:DUF2268 domain-containing protein [Litorihabitans aurantiacus]|uniref:DUF2268 domain-containing protein n=1 Tax=Litorihabitans aurantiacus TaxID=1930061 RepID=A0AA37XGR2_9MICO|nr:DUF2268 domain-containing putative Zn-dependent protease [Litorihabitans aurantiacus]GMA32527.1 hypothetical protein GCM10025875_25190 [Litorihabitans aurantiacus]